MLNLATANNLAWTWESPGLSHVVEAITEVFHKAWATLTSLTDDQCMKRVAAGEEPPFQILFERYGDLVFGYCCKLLKDRERAEDASQEVWVKVIKNAARFKSQGQFRAWLLQIARNTCFSQFRDQKKRKADELIDNQVEDVDQQSILDLMSKQQNKQRLHECILRLPDNQRVALMVWMTEDKSYEEIAEHLETSVSAVKSLLFRSRQSLKEWLGGSHE